ncbi:MAG TPA: cytochrome o ubiquinol oxidase subunit IV [Candidatus Saccharimonadales bacterium]|nr:cytochrome o ubiquinol oxidase subunit IV [Candidatus Saccharimonadales bacterium]
MEENNRQPEAARGSLYTYLTGYILALLLTLLGYLMVRRHVTSGHVVFSHHLVMAVTGGLAIVQLVVQLVYFLHLNRESKPRWNLTVFAFMLLFLLIVVIGSLWIMHNLNYRMMPDQVNNYLKTQDGGI